MAWISAASTSRTDVAAAISAAVDGDIIMIPAGTSTWASGISTTKAVSLIGAGVANTIIQGTVSLLTMTPASDTLFRISGITWDRTSAQTTYSIQINGKNYLGSGTAITQFRIDRCKFNFGKRALHTVGWVYGLARSNEFLNCDIAVGISGDNNKAWLRSVSPGSADALYIEDNTFTVNNTAASGLNEQVYHSEGTRTVVRYNTFDGSAYTKDAFLPFDCHGNQTYNPAADNVAFRGTVLCEFYENTVIANTTYRHMNCRGGTLFIYNNDFTVLSGSTTDIALTEEEGWQTAFFSPLRTVWPADDQIKNTYIWGNTHNGIANNSVGLSQASDSIFIQENRDYYKRAPQAGDTYENYTAYTYPHPLNTSWPPSNAPENLSAAQNGTSTITLSWTDASSDETGFTVERSLNGTTGWTEVADLPAGSTSYTDNTGLSSGTTYYYRVSAYNSYGSSAYATANATIAAAPVLSSGSSINSSSSSFLLFVQ